MVGDDPAVLSVCTGGFLLDAEFTPQRLAEPVKAACAGDRELQHAHLQRDDAHRPFRFVWAKH